jgi:hypothetical protein
MKRLVLASLVVLAAFGLRELLRVLSTPKRDEYPEIVHDPWLEAPFKSLWERVA